MRQIVLDTETTGLETSQDHRIIEIGCVEMINRKLTGRHYHQYINPQRKVDEGAMEVHGITDQFLEDKPTYDAIVEEFMAFIKGAELVIHNAPFDISFLNHEASKLPGRTKSIESGCKVIDTLALARQKHPGQKNNLDALCKRYGVDNSQRDLHGALLDAESLSVDDWRAGQPQYQRSIGIRLRRDQPGQQYTPPARGPSGAEGYYRQ